MNASSPGPRLSIGRKLIYALLPLLLTVVVGEGMLRLIVPWQATERLHRSRGFDPAARYLVPDPEAPDGWVTQIYGEANRETHIPARDDRRRVVLFGGSNTRGFPQGELERLLDLATQDAGIDWEVINLGREGYGSRRVLYLFEQAMLLEPDVAVIYSGHNEFVELGFEQELKLSAEAMGGLSEVLSQLRSFELLASALEEEVVALPPTNLDRADPSQRELPWEETLEVYAEYRQNLGLMCDIAADHDVAVLLCSVVSNTVWLPRVWTPLEPLEERVRKQHVQLFQGSFKLIPKRFRSALMPTIRLRGQAWKSGGSERSADSIPRLRELLGPLARNPQVPAGVVDDTRSRTLWYDPSKWDPVVPEVLDWYAEVMFPDPTAAEVEHLMRAAQSFGALVSEVPDDPRALFMLGLVSWLTDDRAEAVELWRRAASFDRSPNNANARSNGIVLEVAREHPQVTLLDADGLFRSRCPDGVVGYEVMMDACHLQPGARYVLMSDMAQLIREYDLR